MTELVDSRTYWQHRHTLRKGDWRANGAGSTGIWLDTKRAWVNSLLEESGGGSLLDLGCGDGLVADGFQVEGYTGVDLVPAAVAAARERFAGRPGWAVLLLDEWEQMMLPVDVAVSMDVILHLIEDAAYFEHLAYLFEVAEHRVGICSTDFEAPAEGHMRHHQFSIDVEDHFPRWTLVRRAVQPEQPDGPATVWTTWRRR